MWRRSTFGHIQNEGWSGGRDRFSFALTPGRAVPGFPAMTAGHALGKPVATVDAKDVGYRELTWVRPTLASHCGGCRVGLSSEAGSLAFAFSRVRDQVWSGPVSSCTNYHCPPNPGFGGYSALSQVGAVATGELAGILAQPVPVAEVSFASCEETARCLLKIHQKNLAERKTTFSVVSAEVRSL